MTIVIGPGWTIGGGISIVTPPSTATAGWYAGGTPGTGGQTTVDRITFATDTATSTVRGPLSSAAYRRAGATGTLTYGWFGGGAFGTDNTEHSTVQRITYTTDTATASVRGPLSYSAVNLAAVGTDTYGWFGGGYQPVGSISLSTVSRITYATDTATATSRGPLSPTLYGLAASTDSSTYGWFGGGYVSPSSVTRITYANDTVNSTAKGPLSAGRSRLAATGTTSYGWFAAGNALSTVDRIDYANDTAVASVRGPLSLARFGLAASTDTTYGWFGGGFATPGYRSLVDRITYATDTNTATDRGPLSRSVGAFSATSGIQ
jgi:hypothetical protein